MEVQSPNSFWSNLSIGTKLGIGFGIVIMLMAALGFVSLYTIRLEDQAFEQFTAFEEAVALAEASQTDFLNARSFEQTFFARQRLEGYDVAFENYIRPNQNSILSMRGQLDLLDEVLTEEADSLEDNETVNNIRTALSEYEIQLASLLTDVQRLGFVDTGLEGEFRNAAATLESIISVEPSLQNVYLQVRRHEKDFITRLDTDDANATIAFANQLKAHLEASARSASEIATLTGLVDDYTTAFSQYTVLAQRVNVNSLLLDDQVENILGEIDEIVIDEIGEAQQASTQFNAVQETATLINNIGIAVGLIFGIGIAFVVSRNITVSLNTLTETADDIAAGNFDRRVIVNSRDEIGELAKAFNQMVEAIVVRERDVQAIVDVSGRIATILDENRLLQDVADLSKERFNLYHSHIYLMDDSASTLQLTAGAGYVGRQMVAENRTIDMRNQDSIVAQTARTRDSVIVNDVRASETFLPHPLLPDTRSELAVALVARGQVLGVLDVQSDKVGYFNEDILEIMQTFATQIANALSNARLFEEVQRTSRHERALGAIDRQIQSANDLEEALQVTVRELGKALRVPHTAVKLQLSPSENGSSRNGTSHDASSENGSE